LNASQSRSLAPYMLAFYLYKVGSVYSAPQVAIYRVRPPTSIARYRAQQ